ncbi:MAG: SLC13 family permease [Bacteroidota bacterium]
MALDWQAWYTLAALIVMIGALVRNIARPDLILVGTLGLLLLADVVPTEQAFVGFANPAVITIGALFVVAAGVERTSAIAAVDGILRPRSGRISIAILRLMLPTSLLSGILNNTPIVAMLIPRVQTWARQTGIPASKLLIPLSYAAIIGGWVTLIGTSTNVIVHGLLLAEGLPGFSFFDLTWVGIPAMIVGGLYFALVGHRFLPDRTGGAAMAEEQARSYTFELHVVPDGALVGKTVEAAGLRDLENAYLTSIRRRSGEGERNTTPARPDTVLQSDDALLFTGDVEAVGRLLAQDGLAHPVEPIPRPQRRTLPLFEAVLSPSSDLVGKTLRQVDFRNRFGGVVLAIQRSEEPLRGRIGRTRLRAGDLLLIESHSGFASQVQGRRDFALMASLGRPVAAASKKAPIALAILLGFIVIVGFGLMPLATVAVAAALGVIVTGCINGSQARNAIDWGVLVMIAAALGIGQAVEATGLANVAALAIESVAADLGVLGTLILLYAVTNVLAELVTNKAAVALMFPVALSVAADLGVDPKAFALAITIGSAASFLTPIGYQTNLMVMSAGRYRYTDYTRAGLLLSFLIMGVTVSVIAWRWL